MAEIRELKWQECKYFHDSDESTNINDDCEHGLIGQQRAGEAMSFGLKIKEQGYNLYVCGTAGTGKTTFAKAYAEKLAAEETVPNDLCYVYNFENPKCPKLITLPSGKGRDLRDRMSELINRLTNEIPKIFSNKDFEQKKNEIIKHFQLRRDDIIKEMTDEAREQQFGVKSTNSGIYFMPIINGEVINEEQFEALPQEQKDGISQNSESIQKRAADVMRQIKDFEKATRKEVDEMEYSVGLFAVGHHINDLMRDYADDAEVLDYLKAVKEDVLDNLTDFIAEENDEEEAVQAFMPWITKKNPEDALSKYKINLLTDNSKLSGAPVIVDFNPTYANLVGEIEYDNEYGNFSTDFMKIKAGLLHMANGGYLILQAQDILSNPHAWETLRRTLITGQIVTEPLREYATGIAVSGIKPEAIPINIKVILVGGGFYYDWLYSYDDQFEKLFKIRVDFDYEMKLNPSNNAELARFVKSYSSKHNLPAFKPNAVARLIEHAARIAERKDKLTTRFNRLTEIINEAAEWARTENAKDVDGGHIMKAIAKREYRLGIYEEKLSEMIEEDTIMIATDGSKVGQINGLAVIDLGDTAFAKPTRITVTTYMGKAGIVNIEKEADMSGSIHEKGVQVLIGYLGQTYAQDFPLSFSCRICFEQNYSGVDGDSASSTELYAVLSSLAQLPIRQDLAVTGSINQHGEIQPIGGVTYKVEGFFDLCKKRGLTGKQGVIIPVRNVRDLVLKDEVVEAIKAGMFHIYPISHVNEGMEILTGLAPGGMDKKGNYGFDTVHGKVHRRLRALYKKSMKEV